MPLSVVIWAKRRFLVPGKTDFILLDVTLLEMSQHPMHEMTKCQKYNHIIYLMKYHVTSTIEYL